MSRRTGVGLGVIVVALAAVALIAGLAGGHQSSHRQGPTAFAWLRPVPAPADWSVARIRDGATLSYPPGWRPLKTDPGTATAALLRSGDGIVGYLNATPRQGPETLENWATFRPDHNRDEGDRSVHLIASSTGLRFRGGHGSCVIDDYRSSTGNPYREIACLVAGARANAVIVGAAPPDHWSRQRAAIERAISSFLT
jgi:hypothetical protein